MKDLPAQLASEDGSCPLDLNRILPLPEDSPEARQELWDISSDPEELDWVLYRNGTILEYSFDTHNAIPLPFFRKLAETYPSHHLKIEYASDDYGEDCGIYESLEGSGELVFKEPDDPFVFACLLWDIDPDEEMQERMINAYEE